MDWLKRLLVASPPPKAFPIIQEPPMIMQGSNEVREVVIHTTATGADWWKGKTAKQMVDEVRAWHKRQGWSDIGYHGLIAPDGSYADGRPFTKQGAHVKERNRGTIGLVLVPIAEVDPHRIKTFEDYYTDAQRNALRRKIAAIAAMTELRWVTGHNDYTKAKTCPGFYVKQKEWMP
jgi:hypothetical protein